MRKAKFVCSLSLLTVLLFGAQKSGGQSPATSSATTQSRTQAAPPGDAARGKKLYVTYGCYQCHAYVGQGGLLGGPGSLAGPRLAPHPLAFEAFSKQLRHPRFEMPPYTEKALSAKDLADIYAFLLSIPQPPPLNSIPLLAKQ